MNSSAFHTALGLGDPPNRAHLSTAEDERGLIGREPVVAPLPYLGFIDVGGAQALAFLHSQLTNEVQHQPHGTAQLNAYCQAKGRMLASFVQWQRDEAGERQVMLAVSREIAAPVAKRLSMFILRAKARVADVSEKLVAFGWIGAPEAAPELPASAPVASPSAVLALEQTTDCAIMRMADAWDQRRYLIVATVESAPALWDALSAGAHRVGPSLWRLSEIHAGMPRIVAATQERFVPQMVNYELIGGVSFKKGCYPGQEIVARSQYLGKLKRRMFLAAAAVTEIAAGDDVVQVGSAEPVGVVVNAEPNGGGGSDLLVETTIAATEGTLSVRGAALTLLPLPYALPAEQSAA